MESDRPIPAPRRSLGNILKRGVAGVHAELIGAPAIHNIFGSATASSMDATSAQALETKITGKPAIATRVEHSFDRGDDVIDTERKRKGTIIRVLKAAADGQKRFELVDSQGNSWKQVEKRLRQK